MAAPVTAVSNSPSVSSSTSKQSSAAGSNPSLSDALFKRKPPKSSSSKSKSKSKSKASNSDTNPKTLQNAAPHSDTSSPINNADFSNNVSTTEGIDLLDYLSIQDADNSTSVPARVPSSTSTHSAPASQTPSNTSGTTPSSSRFSLFTEDMRDRFRSQPKKANRQQARKERKAAAVEAVKAEARLEVESSPRRDAATEERRRLYKKCYELGVYVVEVNPDGHCLYAAIADQLRLLRIKPTATYQDTRTAAANYMREHPDDFMPFVMMESITTATPNGQSSEAKETSETDSAPLSTTQSTESTVESTPPTTIPTTVPSESSRRASQSSSIEGYERLEDDDGETNRENNDVVTDDTKPESSVKEDIKENGECSSAMNGESSEEDEALNNYLKYCDNIENSAEWGGEPEILALSKTYNTPVHVLEADRTHKIGEEEDLPLLSRSATASSGGLSSMLKAAKSKAWISGNKVKPMRISYHRYMYGLGEHYNSLRPRQPVTTTPIVPMLG